MRAGTIARLSEPTTAPLESEYDEDEDRLRALDVQTTQDRMDGPPVQAGKVADTVEATRTNVSVAYGSDGDPGAIMTDRVDTTEQAVADWVADPQDTGLIAASSTDGDDPLSFPFSRFAIATDTKPERLFVAVDKLYESWLSDESVQDVWMVGEGDLESATIKYHEAAEVESEPQTGVGFARSWSGRVIEGVVYESAYVALYNVKTPETFVGFVRDCVLPHARVQDDDGDEQQTLGE